MPRVSDDYRARRRQQILGAARTAFARFGYEGATVARLEEATGLSRGALFNYFPSKLDLFYAAAEEDMDRFEGMDLSGALRERIEQLLTEDPEWLLVMLEQARRSRADPEFRQRWRHRSQRNSPVFDRALQEEQDTGRIRDDVPVQVLAQLLRVVADGLVVQRIMLDEVPDGEQIVRLVEDMLLPRAT